MYYLMLHWLNSKVSYRFLAWYKKKSFLSVTSDVTNTINGFIKNTLPPIYLLVHIYRLLCKNTNTCFVNNIWPVTLVYVLFSWLITGFKWKKIFFFYSLKKLIQAMEAHSKQLMKCYHYYYYWYNVAVSNDWTLYI